VTSIPPDSAPGGETGPSEPTGGVLGPIVAAVRKGELPLGGVDPGLLDRLESIAAARSTIPRGWRPLLDRRRLGDRAAREGAANLLVMLGHWDGHDDIDTLAKAVPKPFTDEALADVRGPEDVAQRVADLPLLDRPLISVDGVDPLEIDDALWAHKEGDDVVVTIAIASPGDFFDAGGPLDLEVARRASTFYHPRYTTPMLPDAIGDAASLVAGQERPAIVSEVRVGPGGRVSESTVSHRRVVVQRAVPYDEADSWINGTAAPDPDDASASGAVEALKLLWQAAQRSEQRRIENGAWLLYRTAIEVKCLPFSQPNVLAVDQSTAARRLVGESMVLCGASVAAFCRENAVTVPFRCQEQPKQPPLAPGLYTEPADIRSMLRHMSPANPSLQPAPHATLGVEQYVQASSPLRRYLDLMTQRQVIAALQKKPPVYSKSRLQRVIARNRSAIRSYRRSQRKADSYFTRLWLAQQGLGTLLRAQITPDLGRKGRTIAYVDRLNLEIELPEFIAPIGTWVELSVTGVDVRGEVRADVARRLDE